LPWKEPDASRKVGKRDKEFWIAQKTTVGRTLGRQHADRYPARNESEQNGLKRVS